MRGRSQFVGVAGQHYVAYCLSIRGIHAAITLGNVPNVDVVIAKPDGSLALSIQVKTKRWAYKGKHYGREVSEWDVGPSALNAISDNFWYAFVDLQEDLQESRGPPWNPRVFLVPSMWVRKFVKNASPKRRMYLLPKELWGECLERWDRINKFFDRDRETLNWCRKVPRGATWQAPNAALQPTHCGAWRGFIVRLRSQIADRYRTGVVLGPSGVCLAQNGRLFDSR